MKRAFVGLAILAAVLVAWWVSRPGDVSVQWRGKPKFTQQSGTP